MYMSGATKKYKLVNEKAPASQHLKINTVLKIDPTFHSSLVIMWCKVNIIRRDETRLFLNGLHEDMLSRT